MIRPLLCLTLLVLCAVSAHAACPPEPKVPSPAQIKAWLPAAPDRGLLWRISRDGHSSYLYGTLHIGKPDWAVPGPALRAAWADTEVLAVELDPADVMPALATMPPSAPLPPALARRIEGQTRAACLPPGALAALPAMLQLSTLTLLEVRRDGFDVGFGQDLVLLGWAKADGRPVLSLESVQEQLDALSAGEHEVALIDAGVRQLQQGRVRAPLRKLAAAWSRGDLATLGSYSRWCDCADSPAEREWLKRVNDDRNVQLAARIAALHAKGQRMLVAVGALHMSGPQALPRLLAEQGFTLEALLPSK